MAKATKTARQPKAARAPGLRETPLGLSDETVDEIVVRLRRVEGQVRAVQQMIVERRDCHAIAQQMSAARSALERATVRLMVESMAQCLKPSGGTDERELSRLTGTFVKLLS